VTTQIRYSLLCIYLWIIFFTSILFAETIELNNGKKIYGKVIKETEEAIVVSKDDGSFVYSISKDKIKNIRESTAQELKQEYLQSTQSSSGESSDEERERLEVLKKSRQEKYEQEVLAAKKSRGTIKISFSRDRFGVVDAVLNGKVTVSMLVDTGASLVVVSESIAKKLGIEDTSGMPEIPVVLADGRVTTAIPFTLNSVEVGSSKARDVEAAISKRPPGSDIDGLLGMSYLKYFHVKFDTKENCLILERY